MIESMEFKVITFNLKFIQKSEPLLQNPHNLKGVNKKIDKDTYKNKSHIINNISINNVDNQSENSFENLNEQNTIPKDSKVFKKFDDPDSPSRSYEKRLFEIKSMDWISKVF